jgi:glycosyltransferase involved in cell wall biosynthesis
MSDRSTRPLSVAHVLSLVSEDGRFGGPVAVARGQLYELAARGHAVALYVGWDGLARPWPSPVISKLFPARRLLRRGFSTLIAPAMLIRLWRELLNFDIVHVHLARDLVSLPAALLVLARRRPLVIQTHGMVVPDSRRIVRAIDRMLVRRVFRLARAHLVLTDLELKQTAEIEPRRCNLVVLRNGVPPTEIRSQWTDNDVPEVVFCARLHPRKRVLAFFEMGRQLLEDGVEARFSVFGPDEGDLPRLEEAIKKAHLEDSMNYLGPLEPDNVLPRLGCAQVFVLPSVNEPFPMTVLEAMSAGLPSVITSSNGLAPAVRQYGPNFVTSEDPTDLAATVKRLLASQETWKAASRASLTFVRERMSVEAVAATLEDLYASHIE